MNAIEKKKKRPVSPNKRVVGFNILEDRCIWMKAGVVNYRICDNAFDCNACTFNKAICQAMDIAPTVDSATMNSAGRSGVARRRFRKPFLR